MNSLSEGLPFINLLIGGVFASRRPAAIRTVLGSCVAACIFDSEAGIGGMNHFMLPDSCASDHAHPTRFGEPAMEALIRRVLRLGGTRNRLRAKVFGGAHVVEALEAATDVAERNAAFVRRFLERRDIPLLSWRVGGDDALEVIFFSNTGRTLVKPVSRHERKQAAKVPGSHGR